MVREAVKLNVEKHGTKIRYKRQFRGYRWRSKSFDSDTRENKREAWATFVAWRAEYKPSTSALPDQSDPFLWQRNIVAERCTVLIEHAELTANPKDAAIWRSFLSRVPTMDEDSLHNALALFMGEYDGESYVDLIDAQAETVQRLKDASNAELNARTLADEYVNRLLAKAETGQGSYGHHGQVKRALDIFVKWFGESRSLEHLTEKTIRDYTNHLNELVTSKKLSRNSAFNYQAKFRKWLTDLSEDYPDLTLPTNLRSKAQRIPTERKEPESFTVDEVKLLLANATEKTKLFLCLMLNCAMYQGDIADLTAKEVDWQDGRIVRPRSKTQRQSLTTGRGQPYKCNWKLWAVTWELFIKHANREGICFLSEKGNPLIINKANARTDTIRSSYTRLVKKLKENELLPPTWNKTLKQLRKTGANLLEASKKHGDAYSMYLNHSVAKQNYLTSGKPVPSFDAAVLWLGKQLTE